MGNHNNLQKSQINMNCLKSSSSTTTTTTTSTMDIMAIQEATEKIFNNKNIDDVDDNDKIIVMMTTTKKKLPSNETYMDGQFNLISTLINKTTKLKKKKRIKFNNNNNNHNQINNVNLHSLSGQILSSSSLSHPCSKLPSTIFETTINDVHHHCHNNNDNNTNVEMMNSKHCDHISMDIDYGHINFNEQKSRPFILIHQYYSISKQLLINYYHYHQRQRQSSCKYQQNCHYKITQSSLLSIIISFLILFFSSSQLNSQVFAQNKLNNNDDNGNVSSFGQHNLSSPSPLQLLSTTSTTTTMFGSYVFDPHVQAQCERNLMNIMVTFDQPFNGIVHVRNFRRNPCQIYGNGSTIVTMTIDLLAPSNRPNFCGIHRVKGTEERSISLVVRLHKALELSDDKHFVITCGNTEFSNRNKNEKLMFKFVDRHGHKITKLYHGESYRLRAEIVQQQQISSQLKTSKSAYHLYVKNCLIFNGNDTDVEFLDNNGCPTVIGQMLSPFKQIGQNIAEAEIYSMFKLPGTNQLHMQCLVELVENCNFCDPSLCPLIGNETMMIDTTDSNHNITSIGNKRNRPTSEMQMLVSTTVYVFEPDQQMSSSIMLAGIGGKSDGSDDFIHGNCNEWRFPWLIALCIMLGILLIIMMVVNIFLCTSMSCSCFRSEMVEHEPTIMDDYDPYKIDIGSYYSPYDSRLSLNRSTTSIANPMTSTVVGNPHHHYHLQHNTHHHHGNNGDRSGSHYSAQQQPLHLNTVHHHHPHHNRPIPSMSSSYSPSTTENTTHSRPGAKLINNNKNIGNGNKSRNSKPNKSRQQKPSNPKSSSIIPLNGNTYNPYQHSPQSIRSDDYY